MDRKRHRTRRILPCVGLIYSLIRRVPRCDSSRGYGWFSSAGLLFGKASCGDTWDWRRFLPLLALTIGPIGLGRPDWVRCDLCRLDGPGIPHRLDVSQIILAVMFFGLFTPIGLLFRLLGRDSLHRARRPELNSYWAPKPAPVDLRRYFKQF